MQQYLGRARRFAFAAFIFTASPALSAQAAAMSAPDTKPQIDELVRSAPVPRYTCLRQFYVNPQTGRSWTAYRDGGGGRSEPWRSIEDSQAALDNGRPVLRAGDCVNLAPGRHDLSRGVTVIRGGGRNVPNGYVVYRSEGPAAAHLFAVQPMYAMVDIKTAYVILDGLEIDGNAATAKGEGVAATGSAAHHHIVVEHCRIHDLGGGGVQLNDSEYFWVAGNDIYRNASTNKFQESGISVYQPQAAREVAPSPSDAVPFHIVIVDNRSHDNVETFACTGTPECHTDGNGVIIDKTKNVDRADGVPYAGRTLVARNIVYGNGGAGVHLFLSEHVTAAGNIAINDHLDTANSGTWRGELSNVDSGDTLWLGNIGWARRGPGVLSHNSAVLVAHSAGQPAAGVTWRSNLTCGGDPSVYAGLAALDPPHNDWNAPDQACSRAISGENLAR